MKDAKYIIKRIIISVGIIIILSIIRKFLIVNTYALEIQNDTIPQIYTTSGTEFTGDIKEDRISYNYNIQDGTPLEVQSIRLQSTSQMLPSFLDTYPFYSNNISITNNNTYNTKEYIARMESYDFLQSITFTTNSTSNEYIKQNQKYLILIEITKKDNMRYYDNTNTQTNITDLDLDYFSLMAQENSNQVDITSLVNIEKFKYIKGLNLKAGGENPEFSNQSYILIEYTTKEELEEDTYRLTNQTISFNVNKWESIENEEEYFFKSDKYFIYNNNENAQDLKMKFVFLEGGRIDFCGEKVNGIVSCGRYFGNDLDKVTSEDQKVLKQLETCEPLDIACHVRNLLKMLQNIFIRIGNGIKELIDSITSLFIPDFNLMSNKFTELKDTLVSKLGFIWESEGYFEILLDKFMELEEGQVVIDIPSVKVPNFNFEIISAQHWNFSQPFEENETLRTFYNLYKVLISGVFIFLLIDHARHRLGALINAYDMYENGTIREGVKTE